MDRQKIEACFRRVFDHADFDDATKRVGILSPMPDYEAYELERSKLAAYVEQHAIPNVLRPYYDAPLMSRDQEWHLFRQYHYFKHLARRQFGAGHKARTIRLLSKAATVSKLLASANIRLTMPEVRAYRQSQYFDDILGEALFLIVRAVDYFDWRRGIKFSTYATWCLKNTLGRTCGKMSRFGQFFESLDSTSGEDQIEDDDTCHEQEVAAEHAKLKIEQLLRALRPRQRDFIIRRYLLGETLEVVGEHLGVSKERVRQVCKDLMARLRKYADVVGVELGP